MAYNNTETMDLAIFKDKKICVATSGGMDSTALLHFLKSQERSCGYILSAVHCEHGIRGDESEEDMRFVQGLCKEWDVPLHIYREDCPKKAAREKTSLETAARDFRRACFLRLIDEGEADLIATAHHVSDEAETVLFRIARGTSLSGASGMKEKDGCFIRPFLTWTKADIAAYVEKNGLAYRIDSTNLQTQATRNKLRLQVFPALKEAIPSAEENFARFARLAAEDDEFLQRESDKLVSYEGETVRVAFCKEKPLFRRACLTALKALGVARDYTFLHLESAFSLQESERGAKLSMPQGVEVEKTGAGLVFFRLEKGEDAPIKKDLVAPFDERGFEGGMYAVNVSDTPLDEKENAWKTLRIDGDRLPKDTVFRFRREGDEIEKFGGGKKSLKKFFNEKKIPPKQRAYLPLIAEENGRNVYVVCGVEIADSVKVTKETERTLYITLVKR